MHDIREFIPEPFQNPGELLYIGARPDACSWLTELHQAGNEITVLEVWADNLTGFSGDERIAHFLCYEVQSVYNLGDHYDYVWWWHGPEHVRPYEFANILYSLIGMTDLIAVAAPWGKYEQGTAYGNPYEKHLWSVYPDKLERYGMATKTDGEVDKPGSEVVGVWRLADSPLFTMGSLVGIRL